MGVLAEQPRTVEFEIHTVCDDADVRRQVEENSARDIPRFDGEPFPSIKIIANGPSARQAPLDGTTLAVNGALNLFPKGTHPTYWAACDPQEAVADFLVDPPEETIYLVASKCHPKVFERLKDRKVLMWHVADFSKDPAAIPTATTITLCALNLVRRMGFRDIDVWGWDACFRDGEHHAAPRPGETIIAQEIDLLVGDKTFKTTTTWAVEVQDAMMILPVMEFMGATVKIHGPSMVQAIREFRADHPDT